MRVRIVTAHAPNIIFGYKVEGFIDTNRWFPLFDGHVFTGHRALEDATEAILNMKHTDGVVMREFEV